MKTEVKNYVPLVRMYAVREKELPYKVKKADSPRKVAELAKQILKDADREYLVVLSVDSQCKPVALEIISIGTINQALAEPREVMKHALINNAAGIILVHNHPSGNCSPSAEDMKITKRMKEAGNLLGIKIQDHVIVGNEYYSFVENGVLR